MTKETRFMDVHQLSEYLGFSKFYVYELVKKRGMPCIKIIGSRRLRFDKEEIDRWLLDQQVRGDVDLEPKTKAPAKATTNGNDKAKKKKAKKKAKK